MVSAISKLITAENVALLSVVITFTIFVLSKNQETRYKKLEDKKTQYLKLINLMQKTFLASVDKKEKDLNSGEMRNLFFDTGSSLLLYGSKRIYRRYIFFREFTTNPLIKNCTYYKEEIAMYIMSDILRTMRKEVGLSLFNNIDDNDALAFFVNDISSNPIATEKNLDARFRIKMIKFELWMIDRCKGIWIKTIFTTFIRPVFCIFGIVIKYIVVIPFGRVIKHFFPAFGTNVGEN
ncbi:MAG: hypothetical protein J6O61_06885 [Butyrivibrio sp.]|uniref:hypothetical protein n=1 Tax=Butyrivibrio sp. TaxID=28121 RepID=UPI001B23F48F|nr:hypothetical protein [Butyrivibrio sp.]MBO6240542.1 hypothetical protein [Butyrivibrio sp.]